MSERIGMLVRTGAGPGVLHQLTGVIARDTGDISSVEISGRRADEAFVYFEVDLPGDPGPLLDELRALPIVRDLNRQVHHRPTATPSLLGRLTFVTRRSNRRAATR